MSSFYPRVIATGADMDSYETARATKDTRELVERLVAHSIDSANAAEARERQMLRWTQAGVALAALAAVASVVAILVTVLMG